MSIESTYYVRKSNALKILNDKRILVFDNDCNERLSVMLYDIRDSIYENYIVVNDDFKSGYDLRFRETYFGEPVGDNDY